MQGVHPVRVDEPGKIGGAADAADGHNVVIGNLQVDERLLNRRQHPEVAAPRAPVGINPASQIGHRQLTCSLYACSHVRLLPPIQRSDHNLVRGNGKFRFSAELFLDGFHDVMRHERLAVVFANVAVRHKAGFAAQVARKLPAVIVLDDDGVPSLPQEFEKDRKSTRLNSSHPSISYAVFCLKKKIKKQLKQLKIQSSAIRLYCDF